MVSGNPPLPSQGADIFAAAATVGRRGAILGCATAALLRSGRQAAAQVCSWADMHVALARRGVMIMREARGERMAVGSGVLLTQFGLILTARHVVAGDQDALRAGEARLSCVVGWNTGSLAGTPEFELKLDMMADGAVDLAALRLGDAQGRASLVASPGPIWVAPPRDGAEYRMAAHPGGSPFTAIPMTPQGPGPEPIHRHLAATGPGASGAGIYDCAGALVGMHIRGADSTNPQGQVVHGYFLPSPVIVRALARMYPGLALPVERPDQQPLVAQEAPARVRVSNTVSFLRAEHQSATPSSGVYRHTVQAEAGYRIVGSRLNLLSFANGGGQPDVEIAPDGSSATVAVRLRSGPFFDRWRGWLHATIETEQEQRR